jgi:hypothetical protein
LEEDKLGSRKTEKLLQEGDDRAQERITPKKTERNGCV